MPKHIKIFKTVDFNLLADSDLAVMQPHVIVALPSKIKGEASTLTGSWMWTAPLLKVAFRALNNKRCCSTQSFPRVR